MSFRIGIIGPYVYYCTIINQKKNMKLKKKTVVSAVSLPVVALILAFSSCGEKKEETASKTEKQPAVKTETAEKTSNSPGKDLFYAKSKENNIACADCHGDGSNSANTLTKFFTKVNGADKRESTFLGKFKGPDVAANAGGATYCYATYMKMKTPLTAEQISALNSYYSSLPDPAGAQAYKTIALPEKDKSKLKAAQQKIMALTADAAAGEKKFNEACGLCHGDKATVKKVPDIFDEFEGNVKSITYNVRFGDGAMPFFHEDGLSDQDLADIAAYILKKNQK